MLHSLMLFVPKMPNLWVLLQSHICLWMGFVSPGALGVWEGVLGLMVPDSLRGRVADRPIAPGLVDRTNRVLSLLGLYDCMMVCILRFGRFERFGRMRVRVDRIAFIEVLVIGFGIVVGVCFF